jgi:hypothetical protein
MDQTNVIPFATQGKDLPTQISPDARMRELMSACGFRTREELINNAITMFEWAVQTVQQGNQVASFNEAAKSYVVVNMPALHVVAEKVSSTEAK